MPEAKKDRNYQLNSNDVFLNNEIQSNIATASTIVFMMLSWLLVLLLNASGVFQGRALTKAVALGMLALLVPLYIYWTYGPERTWMKHLLLGSLIIALAFIDSILTYKTALLMAIPIVISIRYFSRKTTTLVALATVAAFLISAIAGAKNGLLDLNIIDLPVDINIYVRTRLVEAVKALGLDEGMIIRNTLVLNFAPRCLIFLIIAIAATYSAARGHAMVNEQKRISQVDEEMRFARQLQLSNLPDAAKFSADHNDFALDALMLPAKSVGGDFYDFYFLDDDHLCLLIADVSGKGVAAALFMMACKSTIRSIARHTSEPKKIIERANLQLMTNNDEEMFVTVWLGVLELSTGKMTCVNAGHEYPAIRYPGGNFELMKDKHGLVMAVVENVHYTEYELQLTPGTKIFVYTDGVPEANNAAEELFGLDRMIEALNKDPETSPEGMLKNVRLAVNYFVEGYDQFDDLTMLGFEYKGK